METVSEAEAPWYEARLSVHVRNQKPGEVFGEGGDELAHVRASTQASSFVAAIANLDRDLGAGWERMKSHAELVDQPPSPDVMPKPVHWTQRKVTLRLYQWCGLQLIPPASVLALTFLLR